MLKKQARAEKKQAKKQAKQKQKQQAPGVLLVRNFLLSVIACLCLTGMVCGFLIAGNNTRGISIGQKQTHIVLSQREERLALHMDEQRFEIPLSLTSHTDSLLRFMPAPVSGVYWLLENVVALFH